MRILTIKGKSMTVKELFKIADPEIVLYAYLTIESH